MPGPDDFILGEFRRTLDDRHRLSIPQELVDALAVGDADCVLAKERPGCLSLWAAAAWQTKLDQGVNLIREKMRAGRLEGKLGQVQLFGRLLSTRHTSLRLAGPEGFRELLRVEPGGDVLIVGAHVCVEIWNPADWLAYLEVRMPKFRRLFDRLSG